SWLDAAGVDPLPGIDQCEALAYRLTEIALMGPGPKIAPALPEIEPALGRAGKYGRQFLQYIPAEMAKMRDIESCTSKASRIGLAAREGRKAMQAAVSEMQKLLALFDYPIEPCGWSWHDQARLIALTLRRTLETTGKPYLDVSEESPLCRTVVSVLRFIGHRKKRSTVSAALRGRRGRF